MSLENPFEKPFREDYPAPENPADSPRPEQGPERGDRDIPRGKERPKQDDISEQFKYQEINISGSTKKEIQDAYRKEILKWTEAVEYAEKEFLLDPHFLETESDRENPPDKDRHDGHGLSGALNRRRRAIEKARQDALDALEPK